MAHQDPRRVGDETISSDALAQLYQRYVKPEIQQLVRTEVEQQAAKSEDEFLKALNRVVQKQRGATTITLPGWSGRRWAATVGVVAVLALGVYWMGGGRGFSIWPSTRFTSAPASPVPAPANEEPTPAAVAATGSSRFHAELARYHKLFREHPSELDSLSNAIGAASPALQDIVTAWKDDKANDFQKDSMHAALVQAALRTAGHANLTIDGAITRKPCSTTCGLVMRYWRGDLSKFHVLPPPPPEGTEPTDEQLLSVERALVSLLVPDPQP